MTRATLLVVLLLASCSDCKPNNSNNEPDMWSDTDGGLPDGYTEPFDPDDLGWGLHVIGRAEDEIYVAGGTPDRGILLQFDGAEWTEDDVPDGTPLLNWVALFDDGQKAAVGNEGTILWNDGSGWVAQDSSTSEDLWGIWGSSSGDVWAVGGRGRAAGQATVLRYQGGSWTVPDVPELARPAVNAFFKVWGTGADNVYIVGQNGGCLQWDGTALTEFGVGTSEDLISLWGTGPDDVLLVGGRGNGVLSHWNGDEWHTESISPAPGVNGVWMPSPGEFWIAGARGTLRRGTVSASSSGERSFDVPRTRPLAQPDLHAVYGVPDYGLIAVGGNFEMQDGPYEGLAFRKTEDWQ